MKKLFVSLVIFIFVFDCAIAQKNSDHGISSKVSTFQIIADGMPDVMQGDVNWGDFNRDGNLDIIMCGIDGSNLYTRIYKNNGDSTFTNISAGLSSIKQGIVRWVDFNNDGYLDAFVSGNADNSFATPITELYSNNGNETFTPISYDFTDLYVCDAVWEDFNNDGWADLIMAGDLGTLDASSLYYLNNGDSTFTLQNNPFLDVQNSDIDVLDYNNDGYKDVIITGSNNAVSSDPVSKIYSNNGDGTFSLMTGIIMAGVTYGDVKCGDFNADGFADVFLAGSNPAGRIAKFYKNNGDSTFTEETTTSFEGVIHCSIALADWDNDGDLDIYYSGSNATSVLKSFFYFNDGDFSFTLENNLVEPLAYSAGEWADFNKNGKPELLISGQNAISNEFTQLYTSGTGNSWALNTAPDAPSGLTSEITGCNKLTLKWNASDDSENDKTLNSYNIYIGTSQGLSDVINPLSNISNGDIYFNKKGNALNDTTFIINGLQAGTYYWSVQALDANNMPSAFAAERSFTVAEIIPLTINNQPVNASACAGSDTAVSVSVSGTVSSYQWQYSLDDGSTWRDTTGTEARFVLNDLSLAINQYQFRCLISSPCETLISGVALLTVYSLPENPIITQDGPNLYSSTAENYQWYDENGIIIGATDQMLTPSASGNYYVEVENGMGCTNTSENYTFTYLSMPQITTQPQDAAICQSLDTAFTVATTGDQITYNWQRSTNGGLVFDNLDITTSRLAIENASLSNNGYLYRCKITNNYYEIISDTVELTVHENPAKPEITNNSGALTSTEAATYKWFKNGIIINGATNRTYSPTETGNYTVLVTNSFGCENESDPYNFVVNSLEELNQLGIQIYPNPASEVLNINFVEKPSQVSIYSVSGTKVYSQLNILENNLVINIHELSRGVYFVQLSYPDKIIQQKVLIE